MEAVHNFTTEVNSDEKCETKKRTEFDVVKLRSISCI